MKTNTYCYLAPWSILLSFLVAFNCLASDVGELTRAYCSRFNGTTKEEVKKALGAPDYSATILTAKFGERTQWAYHKGPIDPDTEKPLRLSMVFWDGKCVSIKIGDNSADLTAVAEEIMNGLLRKLGVGDLESTAALKAKLVLIDAFSKH